MPTARPLRWIAPLALVAVVLAGACPASAQPRMLFVGDSITAGQRAGDPDRDGFVALVAQRFPELVVANAGCGGASLRDWTSDEPETLCAVGDAWRLKAAPLLPARITHVMLGSNDAVGFFEFFGPTPAWEYELRLRVLVERAPGLVLLSAPPRNRDHAGDGVDARLRAYREAIARVVDLHPRAVTGIDGYALLDPASDFADAVHPNDRGHARLADALERRLLELLPRQALTPCRRGAACEHFSFLSRFANPGRARRGTRDAF